jgi:hypothetical protein
MPAPLASKQQQRNAHSRAPPVAAATATTTTTEPAAKPTPLILLGLNDEQRKCSSLFLSLHTFLKVNKEDITFHKRTKAENIIIGPATDEASRKMLAAVLPSNLKIKTVEGSRKRLESPFVVLKGVPVALTNEALEDAIGYPCTRLLSAARQGQATSMVRVNVGDEATKKEMLQNGIQLGHQRIRAVPYNGDSTVMQCYKCFGFDHVAKSCKEADRKCRRCGEAHLAAVCPAATPKCLHCGQGHEANHPSCPDIIAKKDERKAKVLTTAATARQPAERIEALRLAACVTSCLESFAKKANISIQQGDIATLVARSVRESFKVSLTGPYVKALLLANAVSEEDSHE